MADNRSPLLLCGVTINPLTLNDILELLHRAIAVNDRLIFLNHNLHSLYLYHTYPSFRQAYLLASYVYVDGIPVIWLGRFAGLPVSNIHRITFLDSFEVILSEASNHNWRVFYLGSTEMVNRQAITILREKYPALNISGEHGFFRRAGLDNESIVAKIVDYKADILFIGMGMPHQEQWLADNHDKLDVRAIFTCGATLDYVVGHAYKPPAWAGPLGLYGLMRLGSDPIRLWRRYLIEPFIVLKRIGPCLLRQRASKNAELWK